jgi:hypothetical protein
MYLSKLLTLLPFSLTKCSAFFSIDKGYFGICVDVGNNKLLVVKCINQLECLESGWSKLCSLRNELSNKLERVCAKKILCGCNNQWVLVEA